MDGDNQHVIYMSGMEGGHHWIPNACRRSTLFGGSKFLVAYPSTGGVVFLESPSAVDLQHLGLPHTHDTARKPEEDDALAARMVQLGAQWWPTWDLYFRHSNRVDLGIFYDYHFPSQVSVAFPTTGGVWVGNFTRDDPQWPEGEEICKPWLPIGPVGWPCRLRFALTMDDKSEMLKDMGATFYNSVDEVPGLAKTVDEAVGLFEPFKERLEKMEDDGYRRRFCSGYQDEDKDMAKEEPKKARWGIGWFFNDL